MKRMNELIDVLNLIHRDLLAIATILICFVLFKDCHGYSNDGIVDELKNIRSTIVNKKFGSR